MRKDKARCQLYLEQLALARPSLRYITIIGLLSDSEELEDWRVDREEEDTIVKLVGISSVECYRAYEELVI
jgi:hypothetical protein